MPRLGSKKSRNGCMQCKARRVKCDECRPCGNCVKYSASCSLLSSHSSASPVSAADIKEPRPSRHSTPLNGRSSVPAPVESQAAAPDPRLPQMLCASVTGGWMEDLELMHHYTAHAYLTMPGVDQAKQLWGYAVPQEAFKHEFLMHTILAFSANHLAYINPSRSHHYRLLASTHQAAALTGLNSKLSTGNLSPDNCHALLVCSSLVTLNAFADADPHSPDVLIDIFKLLRGMSHILYTTQTYLDKGPFAIILKPSPTPPKPPPLLASLVVDLQALSECSYPSVPNDATRVAIDALRGALQNGLECSTSPALRAVMLWPIKLEHEYIEALKARIDPLVITLFHHYCRILEYAGTEWWFLSGWRSISRQLLLHA